MVIGNILTALTTAVSPQPAVTQAEILNEVNMARSYLTPLFDVNDSNLLVHVQATRKAMAENPFYQGFEQTHPKIWADYVVSPVVGREKVNDLNFQHRAFVQRELMSQVKKCKTLDDALAAISKWGREHCKWTTHDSPEFNELSERAMNGNLDPAGWQRFLSMGWKIDSLYNVIREQALFGFNDLNQYGEGRCGEQTYVMVEVQRALGIPTRMVFPLMWAEIEGNHAWIEFYDPRNEKWTPLGATEVWDAGQVGKPWPVTKDNGEYAARHMAKVYAVSPRGSNFKTKDNRYRISTIDVTSEYTSTSELRVKLPDSVFAANRDLEARLCVINSSKVPQGQEDLNGDYWYVVARKPIERPVVDFGDCGNGNPDGIRYAVQVAKPGEEKGPRSNIFTLKPNSPSLLQVDLLYQ